MEEKKNSWEGTSLNVKNSVVVSWAESPFEDKCKLAVSEMFRAPLLLLIVM